MPIHPAAAAPTSKNSGTARSGRRVAPETRRAARARSTAGDCTMPH